MVCISIHVCSPDGFSEVKNKIFNVLLSSYRKKNYCPHLIFTCHFDQYLKSWCFEQNDVQD